MIRVFVIFVLLQLADAGTTAAAISLGGSEGNPIMKHFLSLGPVQGLVIAKLIAVAVGLGCLMAGRLKAVRRINVAFAAIAVWNTGIIALLVAKP